MVWCLARQHDTRGNPAADAIRCISYSQYNLVEDNDFRGNSVGIFLMYSDSVIVRRNHISHAVYAAGVGIGFGRPATSRSATTDPVLRHPGLHLDVPPSSRTTKSHPR